MIHLRRSLVVRVSIAVGILAAFGVGFAIGYAVHSPSTAPARAAGTTTTTHRPTTTSTSTSTSAPAPTTTAAPATTTTNPARQILAPATTPPVVDECSVAISQSADGNPYPTTCPGGGGVNVVAWRYIANSYSNILGLGASATEQQVLQAMCNASAPGGEVSLAGQVAAMYYGWSFASALNSWYPGNTALCG
jgi:cytoskeletal protein RodZ